MKPYRRIVAGTSDIFHLLVCVPADAGQFSIMGTSLFDQLSDELILEIVKQAERDYGNTSLAPFALCSRRLNNIASPLLYRSFTQRSTNRAALTALLRTVMQKPILGAEVKKLAVTDIDQLLDNIEMSPFSPVNFQHCQITIRSLEISIDKFGWMAALKRGSCDAMVALLLFFLPSLEEFNILSSGGSESFPSYLNQIVRHIAFNQRIKNPIRQVLALSSLQRFSYNSGFSNTHGETGVILPWCEIPSMRTVRAFMWEEDNQWVSSLDEQVSSPSSGRYHVQNLRMEDSGVDTAVLRILLPCFDSLNKFYYRHGCANGEPVNFLPHRIGEALAHLHDSLEELALLSHEWDTFFEDEEPGPLGSLSEFTKLRCLGTDAEVLFGAPDLEIERPQLATILPTSLEILVIRRCEDAIYDDLPELLGHGKDKFHALKTVAIDIPKARAGGISEMEVDRLHQREEEVKRCLERLAIDPETAVVEGYQLQELTVELESIQSNQPTPEEWRAWRIHQEIEKNLIAEYKDAGIELRFNLYSGHTWTFMPSFMVY